MNECINAWPLAIAGDANPGQGLKVGTLGSGYEKQEATHEAWEEGVGSMEV